MHGWFSLFNVVSINQIILTGDRLDSVWNIHISIAVGHTTVIMEVKHRMEVTLYKEKSMWISSHG